MKFSIPPTRWCIALLMGFPSRPKTSFYESITSGTKSRHICVDLPGPAAGAVLQFSKGTTLFRRTYAIILNTSNVGGLRPRASVLLSGVQVGTVSDIKL